MVWKALFNSPEGWIIIAVTVISIVVAIAIKIFISKQIRKDEAAAQQESQD